MVYDGHAFEPLAQKAYPPVDLMKPLLAVGVLGVFRAVALRGGFRYRLGYPRAFVVPQQIEFIPQPLGSFGSDVLGAGRSGGAIS